MARFIRPLTALTLLATPAVAEPSGVIAYVAPSRDNAEIRIVDADGGGERTLFTVPDGTPRNNGIGTLAWSPDGKHLAFSSSHGWKRSIRSPDIYTIPRDGGEAARISTAPDPSTYDDYPKGKVKVLIRNPTHTTADLVIWINGASEPFEEILKRERQKEYVFEDVADFGENVRQYVRVFNKTSGTFWGCWMEAGAFVDVIPGETADAGTLSYMNNANCIRIWAQDWIDDKTLAALAIEWPYASDPPNNIWAFSANPKPGEQPIRLMSFSGRAVSEKVFAVKIGPSVIEPRQAVLLRYNSSMTAVLLTEVDDMEQITPVNVGRCPDVTCSILDLAWRSDGEAFYFSERRRRGDGTLFEFDGKKRREILSLPGEVIGRIAVSPDGKTIAFERSKRLVDHHSRLRYGDRLLCPCSIWTVDVDGGNLREFIADGRAPAWAE